MPDDHIHSPPHYMAGDYECHQIQDALASTLWKGDPKVVRLGNALKYLWRACSKGKRDEDLRKAATEILLALDEDWRMRVRPGAAVCWTDDMDDAPIESVPFEIETSGGSFVRVTRSFSGNFCSLRLLGRESEAETAMSKEDALKIGGALVAWAKGESK